MSIKTTNKRDVCRSVWGMEGTEDPIPDAETEPVLMAKTA
jgi:hypothetical protein